MNASFSAVAAGVNAHDGRIAALEAGGSVGAVALVDGPTISVRRRGRPVRRGWRRLLVHRCVGHLDLLRHGRQHGRRRLPGRRRRARHDGLPSAVARTERVDGVGIEIVQRPELCPSLLCAPVVRRLRLREEGRVEAGFVGE